MNDKALTKSRLEKAKVFKACCRFLKITYKDLYYTHFKNTGIQRKYTFEMFKSVFDAKPTCIFNTCPRAYEKLVHLHSELVLRICDTLRKEE
jgi:hypothetical protein